MEQVFRAQGDEGRVVLLVAALHEPVVGNPPARSGGQVDHVIGAAPVRIVETVALDHHLGGARLEVVAAGAALEPALAHGERADVADIERMRAARVVLAGAEAAEGRTGDKDADARIGAGEDALLAVLEPRQRDIQGARFQPDARAVAVGDIDAGKGEPADFRSGAAQHQRRLALASAARKRGGAGGGGLVDDHALLLHRALAVGTGRDADGGAGIADRIDRVLQAGIAAPGLDHGERRSAVLPGDGGKRESDSGQHHGRAKAKAGHAAQDSAESLRHHLALGLAPKAWLNPRGAAAGRGSGAAPEFEERL